jgi:hypothetical protein
MTAQLNVIGAGRVLNHRELVGRSLCYFLTIEYAGRTFRWCFPNARDVWETAVDGDSLHFQGMDFPQMSQSFDFDSDSPVDISVSFEDLTLPGDVDLPELIAQGHRLERSQAELAVLPDHDDALWSERYIVLLGEVREPVYGDPETHANTCGFTVDSPSWEDSALFPPESWIVTEEVWPDAHESAIGKVFPFVFGTFGLGLGHMASPGLPVRTDRYMFAGHLVTPTTYDASVYTVQNFLNTTTGEDYQGIYPSGPRVELATHTNGFQFTDCNFTGSTNYTFGDEIWISNWGYSSGSAYWIATNDVRKIGGYPDFQWDRPLNTGGDVLYFMLLQSSLKVDRGRTAVAQALLQGFKLGSYIDERVSPIDWINDNLIPILPVSLSQGPKGIFPIVWRYDAGPHDCVGSFIEGPRWRRVSVLERDDAKIFNQYTFAYALDGSDYTKKFGIDGSLEESTDTSETGATYVPNLFARRSYLEHGPIAVEESSDLVWTKETAAAICSWKIRANAFAKRFVTYEASAEHAWLEPGDPILLTDPDLYFTDQLCLVRTKTWDVTSVLYELLILTDPVREQVPVAESEESSLVDVGSTTIFWTDAE